MQANAPLVKNVTLAKLDVFRANARHVKMPATPAKFA
jgi:hypothetical protein